MTHVARVLCFSEYAERHGFQLVVDLKSYYNNLLEKDLVGKVNAWEYYYDPPFSDAPDLESLLQSGDYYASPISRKYLLSRDRRVQGSRFAQALLRLKKTDFINPSVQNCLANREDYLRCCEIYQTYIRFNEKTAQYLDAEYQKLLAGKRVVGVSIRGTDYSVKRTYGHPIQPEIGDVINKVRDSMRKYSYQYIYLSCEEHKAVDMFEAEFPGQVIVNQRQFFDSVDFTKSPTGIWAVKFDRENDAYLRGLEYLSSMNLLARCDALIGGINTGSQMAYIMNNDKYEHVYFYNLGLYGIDDQ